MDKAVRKKLSLNKRLRKICRYIPHNKREDKKQQTSKFLVTYIIYITTWKLFFLIQIYNNVMLMDIAQFCTNWTTMFCRTSKSKIK